MSNRVTKANSGGGGGGSAVGPVGSLQFTDGSGNFQGTANATVDSSGNETVQSLTIPPLSAGSYNLVPSFDSSGLLNNTSQQYDSTVGTWGFNTIPIASAGDVFTIEASDGGQTVLNIFNPNYGDNIIWMENPVWGYRQGITYTDGSYGLNYFDSMTVSNNIDIWRFQPGSNASYTGTGILALNPSGSEVTMPSIQSTSTITNNFNNNQGYGSYANVFTGTVNGGDASTGIAKFVAQDTNRYTSLGITANRGGGVFGLSFIGDRNNPTDSQFGGIHWSDTGAGWGGDSTAGSLTMGYLGGGFGLNDCMQFQLRHPNGSGFSQPFEASPYHVAFAMDGGSFPAISSSDFGQISVDYPIATFFNQGFQPTLQVDSAGGVWITDNGYVNGTGNINDDGSGNITGSGTVFTTQLKVGMLMYSYDTGLSATITGISDDSDLTLSSTIGATGGGFQFKDNYILNVNGTIGNPAYGANNNWQPDDGSGNSTFNSGNSLTFNYGKNSGYSQLNFNLLASSGGVVYNMQTGYGIVYNQTGGIYNSEPSGTNYFLGTNGSNTYLNAISGNVGIGTSSPAYKLDVAGDINTSTEYRVGGSQIAAANLADGTTGTGAIVLASNLSNYPKIVAQCNQTGLTSTYTGFTYTPASAGTFEISAALTVTAISTSTVILTISYTDDTNTSRTNNYYTTATATPIYSIASTGAYLYPTVTIRSKAGTAININASVGGKLSTATYNLNGAIKQIV